MEIAEGEEETLEITEKDTVQEKGISLETIQETLRIRRGTILETKEVVETLVKTVAGAEAAAAVAGVPAAAPASVSILFQFEIFIFIPFQFPCLQICK